jgi:hypothetical protein
MGVRDIQEAYNTCLTTVSAFLLQHLSESQRAVFFNKPY